MAGLPPGLPPAGRPGRRAEPSAEPVVPAAAQPSTPEPVIFEEALALTSKEPAAAPPRKKRPRAAISIPRVVSPLEESAFATVEAEMGGRGKLVSSLLTAQLPPALEKVLGMIADPQHDGLSLAKICAQADCSLSKLMGMFRSATLARGQMIAMARIAEKIPDVAASVMDDSVAGWRECLNCAGARTVTVMDYPPGTLPADIATTVPIEVIKPCMACSGRGLVYWQPPHDTQKTALMIAGLLDKGGPKITTIVANQNIQAGTDASSYDGLIAAMDKAIYGEGRARGGGPAGGQPGDIVEGELGD